MSNYLLKKNLVASVAIPVYRIVKFVSAETVAPATGPTDFLIGAVDHVSPGAGERCDVALMGIAYIEAGAPINKGVFLTSDGLGRCVIAMPGSGLNFRLIGQALEDASAAGDVIRVLLQLGSIQG